MMARRLGSGLLSLVIAATAPAAAGYGAALVGFDMAVRRVEAAAAVPDRAERTQWVSEADPAAEPKSALAPWRAVPGMATAACGLIAGRPAADSRLAARLFDMTQALSLSPTDGAQWLALADATLRLGYGTEHALAAYDMATLTARREGDQMFARALLVLREWEQMPEEKRQAAMGQLNDLRWLLKQWQLKIIAALVAAQTPGVRAAITETLPEKARRDRAFTMAVGLQDDRER